MKTYRFLLTALLAATTLHSSAFFPGKTDTSAKSKQEALTIRFKNVVGRQPLLLNDSLHLYRNANGDDFVVTTFKYYISNIALIKANGENIALPDTYLLVNAADSTTLSQQLPGIPPGKYTGISFIIGVDSVRNFAGAQTGALDPAKGMFWAWNTGYIFVKLEGQSSRSTAKKNRLTFHIGGAKAPNNTIRPLTQQFPKALKIDGSNRPEIELVVNAGALFQGKTTIDFAKLNFTMGGPNSVVVADNYADGLFKVGKIKN